MSLCEKTKAELIERIESLEREIAGLRREHDAQTKELAQLPLEVSDAASVHDRMGSLDDRYRYLAENINDAIWTMDKNLTFTFMSPSSERISGHTPGELIGCSLAKLLSPASLSHLQEIKKDRENFEREHPGENYVKTLEMEVIHKDGSPRWIEATIKSLRDPEGRQTGYIGTTRDIMEKKAMIRQLEERNRFIETILDNLTIGLAVNSTGEGKATYLNRQFEKIYGWPREALTDITAFFNCVYPDPVYRKQVEEMIMADIMSGDPERMEWDNIIITTKSGEKRRVHAKNIPLAEQKLMISTVQDITEEKLLEENLRKTNDALQAIIDSSPYAIIDIDSDLKVRSIWNPAAERMFGWKKDEVIGKKPLYIPDDRRIEAESLMRSVLEGNTLTGIETKRRKRDGTLIDIELTTSALRDGKGEICGAMGMLKDITDQKSMEVQFIQAQKMETVGRLAGGIAHDFNNLLTVIIGHSELLRVQIPRENPHHATIDEIAHTAERAAELTRQLLAFSRRQIIEPKIINLNKALHNMNKMLRRLIGEDIELVTLFDENLWMVRIDPGQVEQVVVNLVVNARDAMPDGGTLTIETKNVQLGKEYGNRHISAIEGECVMIAVSDTGTGMDEGTRLQIFEPFFTTKEPGKGTGLGLSTCYGIVKQNEGDIWVYSEPGQGTAVKVYLPKAAGSPEKLSPGAAAQPPRGEETILVVEDADMVRQMIIQILTDFGYTALEAQNGEEALRLAERGDAEFDLLITDVIMPRMGGKELMKNISLLHPGVKVLFISGYTDDSIVHHGVLDEGIDFLQKPFTPSAILNKVREILDRQ